MLITKQKSPWSHVLGMLYSIPLLYNNSKKQYTYMYKMYYPHVSMIILVFCVTYQVTEVGYEIGSSQTTCKYRLL